MSEGPDNLKLAIETYKKAAKTAYYINVNAARNAYECWQKCYALSCMLPQNKSPGYTRQDYNLIYLDGKNKIEPVYEDSINIVYACSRQYAPYCGISISSLIACSEDSYNYDIMILLLDLPDEFDMQEIAKLSQNHLNISIRFINCSRLNYFKNINSQGYFSADNYLRFLTFTDIFLKYERVIYLDSDTIVNSDVSKLFKFNIGKKTLAAVRDICVEYLVNSNSSTVINGTLLSWRYYVENILCIRNVKNYFNSGVYLINLAKIRNKTDIFKIIKEINKKIYVGMDQCIANKLFYNDVEYLSLCWNVQDVFSIYGNAEEVLNDDTIKLLKYNKSRYKIMHFLGPKKPWYCLDAPSSLPFVKYAKDTAWFDRIAYASLADKAPKFIEKMKGKLL